MSKKGKKVKSKKRKLKLKVLIAFLIIILFIASVIIILLNRPITNIYITGNNIITDEDVINIAKLKDYPNVLKINSLLIKNNLESNEFIRKARVKRKNFFKEVYITIDENYPLFTYEGKTYLYDLKIADKQYASPLITNQIPDDIYDKFVKCMRKVDLNILNRISEIKYDPNTVDKNRFYLTMNDGIYVYVTLNKFENINDYSDIVITLNNKKGILYLDSGGYFEVFNE